LLEVNAVEIGDFELATGAGFEDFGDFDDPVVVEIQAGDRVVGFRVLGSPQRKDFALIVEFVDTKRSGSST
jgi:hypothetical protein